MNMPKNLLIGIVAANSASFVACVPDVPNGPTDITGVQIIGEAIPGDEIGIHTADEEFSHLESDAQLAGYVDLHQTSTVWDPNVSNQVKIKIKNRGTVQTSKFTYDFTINGWYTTATYTQNNPISPGGSITFYCYASGMTLTSCEMNGYPYYIAPDDIRP